MQIQLNGEQKTVSAPLTVAQLLDAFGWAGRRVAVEINQEIVPRSRHDQHTINDADRVEVVVAIGGG